MSKINEKRRIQAAIEQLEAHIAEQHELLAMLHQQSAALGQSWHCGCGATAFIPAGQNPPASWWIWDDGGDTVYHACPRCARRDKLAKDTHSEWRRAGWTKRMKQEDKNRRRGFIGHERSREEWLRPRLYLDHNEGNLYRGSKLHLLGYLSRCQDTLFPLLEEWCPQDEWDAHIPDDVRVVHLDNHCAYTIINLHAAYAEIGEEVLLTRGIELE